MEKVIQNTKRQEEHFVRTYAHMHRFLPDKGYYVTVDNYSDPTARTNIATNWNIDHLSNPELCEKRDFMKVFREAIAKMSGVPEADTIQITSIRPDYFNVQLRQDGVDVRFNAKYIHDGHFTIEFEDITTPTGDSVHGFLKSMDLLDFLKSELVTICRENIHVDKDAVEEDELVEATAKLNMIRDSYL